MIADPQRRGFTLVDGREVTFVFFRADRFGHVLRDHFLNENEPWARLLHLKVKRLENLRQQSKSGDVLKRDAAEKEIYPQCVDVLAEGIRSSIARPVYVEFTQARRRRPTEVPAQSEGFYFLAEAGFLVVVREHVLRTAYFEMGIRGRHSISRVGLFLAAWHKVKDLTEWATEYLDSKDQEYVNHVAITQVSVENWIEPPFH